MSGMSSHQSAKMLTDEWITPAEIIGALVPFDLDPCSPYVPPWHIADRWYTIKDNGLLKEWSGLVWCNPPYGKYTKDWLNRCAMHNNCLVLIFARTETKVWFDYIWPYAKSILFIKGRLYFHDVKGVRASFNSGAPSVIIAYGDVAHERLRDSRIKGKLVTL